MDLKKAYELMYAVASELSTNFNDFIKYYEFIIKNETNTEKLNGFIKFTKVLVINIEEVLKGVLDEYN